MNDYLAGRTWSNAPSAVKSARALAWLGSFVGILLLIVTTVLMFSGGFQLVSVVSVGIYVVLVPIYIGLLIGLKNGSRIAYWGQLVLAIFGLLGFPLGTILYGYILFMWFKPETKAWFGV